MKLSGNSPVVTHSRGNTAVIPFFENAAKRENYKAETQRKPIPTVVKLIAIIVVGKISCVAFKTALIHGAYLRVFGLTAWLALFN